MGISIILYNIIASFSNYVLFLSVCLLLLKFEKMSIKNAEILFQRFNDFFIEFWFPKVRVNCSIF